MNSWPEKETSRGISSPSSSSATSERRAAGQTSRLPLGSAAVSSCISRMSRRSPAERLGGFEKKAATSWGGGEAESKARGGGA